MTKVLDFVVNNWVIFGLLGSVLGVILGLIFYEISPLQPLEEIAFKQKEYKRKEQKEGFKNRMVRRHFKLGNEFLNVSQLEAAKVEFKKVLILDPQNIEGQMGLFKAEIFEPIVKDDYDPEIIKKRLNLIQEENPKDPHAFLFLGDVYSNIAKDKALEYYKKAINSDPSVASAYMGMGNIYADKKDDKDMRGRTLEMYEEALKLSQWNQSYLNNISYEYLRMGKYDKAIEKYALLLSLQDQYLPTYYSLSKAYRFLGNWKDAHWYQSRLCDLLDDEKVISKKNNAAYWSVDTDSTPVGFWDLKQKKFYAYYSFALTCYLMKDESEIVEKFIKRAKGLKLKDEDESEIKRLMNFDVKKLQARQKEIETETKENQELKSKISEFKKRFL